VLSIFQLVCELFTFLSKVATQEFVVNTRDGELAERQLFRDFNAGKSVDIAVFTKLTRNELNRICFGDKKRPGDLGKIRMRIHFLTVLSPFLKYAQFSFDGKNFIYNISRLVKQSGEKLEDFLASFDSGSQNAVDLKSLLHP